MGVSGGVDAGIEQERAVGGVVESRTHPGDIARDGRADAHAGRDRGDVDIGEPDGPRSALALALLELDEGERRVVEHDHRDRQREPGEVAITDEEIDSRAPRFLDAVMAWGDEAAIADRIQAHYDAGATHVCIQPVNTEDRSQPDWRLLEAQSPKG